MQQARRQNVAPVACCGCVVGASVRATGSVEAANSISSPAAAAAVASVDRAKLDRTVAAARALVRLHKLERYRVRFDVIGFPPDGRAVWRQDVLRVGQLGE